MAAAYAALLSVEHIIHQIKNHPSPPISLDDQQLQSLTQTLTFFQEFLERYTSPFIYTQEADPLETRIADAAHAAADLIESHVFDIVHLEHASCINFYQDLHRVMEEMDFIKKEVLITEKAQVQSQLQRNVSALSSSTQTSSSSSIMVGFDDLLLQILDMLTGARLDRQVIPIVGMAGIGKTTLAKNVYAQPLIKHHFDVCAWATISQQHNEKKILYEICCQVVKESKERLSKMSENELGLALHKCLSYRRFLIVMDDMWSIEAWYSIQLFFPENNNGSRIIVTTRLSKVGSQLDRYCGLEMRFLDRVSSWDLFSKVVFGNKICPPQLKEIGKKIVDDCKGLPLSIVVMGGLLEKLEHTQECWETISKNTNAVVNSENDQLCLNILKMSYNHLPVYLKPCFLYIGMLEEDSRICASELIKLWVSEGFLKPINGKTMETVAEENIKDLADRNLILVDKLGLAGNIKYCKIHDLLRDLCLREAQKERFDHFIKRHCFRGIVTLKPSAQDTTCFRMLRILQAKGRAQTYLLDDVFQRVNLRYLHVGVARNSKFPPSVNLLWNLHTLILAPNVQMTTVPVEIWKMPQLRHVKFVSGGAYLPVPGPLCSGDAGMENLQTLKGVIDFKLGEEVISRLPNIKKLKICMKFEGVESHGDYYCFSNFDRLRKLESLRCQSWGGEAYLHRFTFPHSLKKLYLDFNNHFDWDNLLEKIGSLGSLEKLTLKDGLFKTGIWETVEGHFPNLKLLSLDSCSGLEQWKTTESSHFPCLEDLRMYYLGELEEIPSAVGEIPTLRSIKLVCCSKSAVESALMIEKEQKELQGGQLYFRVHLRQ